jgi:glycosyltransferase involved in cell wall biosynthesis
MKAKRTTELNEKRTVWIAFPEAISFSGQTAAAEILVDELTQRGWDCRVLAFPALNRAVANPIQRYGSYAIRTLFLWFRILRLAFVRRPLIYFTHGQSLVSFLRSGLPHWFVFLLNPGARVAMALHGSVFMEWQESSRELRIFKRLLRCSDCITVLGQNQKDRILQLGVPEEKVHIVLNTCTLEIADADSLSHKFSDLLQSQSSPLRLLHLSLLIESKGYPEFLEALVDLSKSKLPRPIEAVLCGPLSFSAYCHRFTTEQAKIDWIEEKIDEIRQSSTVKISWIRGARGSEKKQLFDDSHLFVFPSTFPVEAQPLVIVEAMASGCAVLASTAGEIPSSVDAECADLLAEPTSTHVARTIREYLDHPERISTMAQAGVRRARTAFARDRYVDQWESLWFHIMEQPRK